jgi:hypothetical protein
VKKVLVLGDPLFLRMLRGGGVLEDVDMIIMVVERIISCLPWMSVFCCKSERNRAQQAQQ